MAENEWLPLPEPQRKPAKDGEQASPPEAACGLSLGPVLAEGAEPIAGYRLVRELGRGGFGQVWEAIGPGGVAVALKFIELHRPAMEAEVRSIELMRRVHHAHISGLFGVWHQGSFIAMAMELADRTLMHRLRECVDAGLPGIPLPELLEYFREAAKGIDYLNHRVDLQHCDIKPQNLLLIGGSIKVADFGVVKLLRDATADTNISMTPAYAAPEFLNQRVTRWSDQYSLAITYCQLRANRLPFEGPKLAVLAGHLTRPPNLEMLPETERPPVARALAKEPSQRWPSCRDFVEALAQAAGGTATPLPHRPAVSSSTIDSTVRKIPSPEVLRAVAPQPKAAPTGSAELANLMSVRRLLVAVGLLLLGGMLLLAITIWREGWPALTLGSVALACGSLGIVWTSRKVTPGPNVVEEATQPAGAPLEATQVSPVNAELLALAALQASAPAEPPAPSKPPAPAAQPALEKSRPASGTRPAVRPVKRAEPPPPPASPPRKPEPKPPPPQRETRKIPVAQEPAKVERPVVEPPRKKVVQTTMLGLEIPDAILDGKSAPLPEALHRKVAHAKRARGVGQPAIRLLPIEDVALLPGQSVTVELRLERRNCRGGVELFLQGVPPGILTRTPLIPADTDVGRIELIATPKAMPGETKLRLNAQCSDVTARASFTLTVRDAHRVKSFTNSLGMKFVLVTPGSFFMGSNAMESHRDLDEGPQHVVRLTTPAYFGVFPVTQAEFQRVMGINPSYFSPQGGGFGDVVGLDTGNFPVEQVSWEQAEEFCRTLSTMPTEKAQGRRYRLPTEAEWEYACRAGRSTPFAFGDTLSRDRANDGYLHRRPCKVGSFPANAWGLCDVHGNVSEWCHDWYAENYYSESPEVNPTGPDTGELRVTRGGSFADGIWRMRCAARGKADPALPSKTIGFRVVCNA